MKQCGPILIRQIRGDCNDNSCRNNILVRGLFEVKTKCHFFHDTISFWQLYTFIFFSPHYKQEYGSWAAFAPRKSTFFFIFILFYSFWSLWDWIFYLNNTWNLFSCMAWFLLRSILYTGTKIIKLCSKIKHTHHPPSVKEHSKSSVYLNPLTFPCLF